MKCNKHLLGKRKIQENIEISLCMYRLCIYEPVYYQVINDEITNLSSVVKLKFVDLEEYKSIKKVQVLTLLDMEKRDESSS